MPCIGWCVLCCLDLRFRGLCAGVFGFVLWLSFWGCYSDFNLWFVGYFGGVYFWFDVCRVDFVGRELLWVDFLCVRFGFLIVCYLVCRLWDFWLYLRIFYYVCCFVKLCLGGYRHWNFVLWFVVVFIGLLVC